MLPQSDPSSYFAALYASHAAPMYRLALRATKSGEQAQDIVQDVFLKCWLQRQHWNEIADMEAWLYRVIANQLIDFLRKAAADQRKKQQIWQRIQHLSAGITEEFDARETANRLQAAIDQLPAQRKTIFLLNREEELSYSDIAEKMNISRHTVKNQISAALTAIRKGIGFFF